MSLKNLSCAEIVSYDNDMNMNSADNLR